MKDLEARVAAIEERNARVAQDKAWETSWTRRLSLAGVTYTVVGLYLAVIDSSRPWVEALVPAVGFLLSTLLLKSIRQLWQKSYNSN